MAQVPFLLRRTRGPRRVNPVGLSLAGRPSMPSSRDLT